MDHFLEISQLSLDQINTLLKRANYFKTHSIYPSYSNQTIANLFYEASTRTRISFEMAAKRLSMPCINVDLEHSSEKKGEAIEDTVATLAAMGINLFVVRHVDNGLPQRLANQFKNRVHVINAGDGQHAHPSQAMLDLMTIVEKKPDLSALKIAIVGNIRHSRVANSLQYVFAMTGLKELFLVAPPLWQPQHVHFGHVTSSLEEGISNADVIICLRVQRERLLEHEELNLSSYRQDYAITQKILNYTKPDVMIMHPGPLNRGVEIDSEVADNSQSFILEQVKNGVFMRMAILEALTLSL